MTAPRMPTVFFGHGTPMIALKENDTTRSWRAILDAMPRPKAILCVSAHWLTRGIGVTAQANPPTIHDFGNFPPPMHQIQYPAPGSAKLAARVIELLAPDAVVPTDSWGFDHGCWTVLMKARPQADIPVIQLSLDATRGPDAHFALGRRLRPLRDEGVLVMGTGNIVHNLSGVIRQDHVPAKSYATNFAHAIKQAIIDNDAAAVIDFASLGEDAARSVPTPDHFWPLLYTLGARHDDDLLNFTTDFIEYSSIDMTTVTFSPPSIAA